VNGYYKFLEELIPATVNIQTLVKPEHPSASVLGSERAGSGTFIDGEGHILTVGYVVMGAAVITVTLQSGAEAQARLLYIDYESGLAVLQAEVRNSPTIPLGQVGALRPGQMGLLIASTDLTARRVTEGIITSIGPFDAYWEYMVDRAILTTGENPGFGGGAFMTLAGEMVGVVSLNLGGLKDASMIIPLDYFQCIRDDLFAHGEVRERVPRAWIGLYPMPSPRGIIVFGLTPTGPADLAGVKPGDTILSLDDHEVVARADLYRRLWQHRAGEEVVLSILREGRKHILPIISQDRAAFYA
jgi:S1-C subfamily serine protease